MNILESCYEIHFSKINFIERKVKITNPKTILYGAPKTGKSFLIYDFLSKDTLTRGLYSLVIENDSAGLKQWFYISSLLRVESCKYSGGWDMWTPHAFIFPLLTDNRELIQKYSSLTTVNDNDHHKSLPEAIHYPKEGRFNVLRFQAVLRQDWDTVNRMKELFFEISLL